ncbi:hypothetical protein [Marinovum sp.]|uniref:hypothetical protein n=1 Tax=Marinovum sp. TaxID=2024839 RepID=UPI003A942197
MPDTVAKPKTKVPLDQTSRFDFKDPHGVKDTKTGLTWDIAAKRASRWSTGEHDTDVPDGDLFTKVLAEKNAGSGRVVLPPQELTHSETGAHTDQYAVGAIVLKPAVEGAYSDWRVPDVRELTELFNHWGLLQHISLAQNKGNQTLNDSASYFTSTLVRVDKAETPTECYIISGFLEQEDDKEGKPILGITGYSGDRQYPLKFARSKKMLTTDRDTASLVMLVRGTESYDPDTEENAKKA